MGLKDKSKHSLFSFNKNVNEARLKYKNINFFVALKHASSGLRAILLSERNFRFHIIVASITIILAVFLKASLNDFLWLGVAITLVLITEIINTIIENIIDLMIGPDFNTVAKNVKDMAAGMVLVAAGFAIIVFLFILIPLLVHFLHFIFIF